jgi:serine/threonine-protein kinase HipA
MSEKCLYCYKALKKSDEGDFHEHCSVEFFGTQKAPILSYSFNEMAELAKHVIDRSIAMPGVQPKLSLSLVNEAMNNKNDKRLTIVGALGGNYIFKPPSETYPEMPQNEHVTMRIAEAFGIRTVQSSLIRLQSGELSFITKRIDRTISGEKIHMLDMFQILEAVDKYKSSMEKVGKALGEYSSNTLLDKLYFFELSVFSFLTGNNDMHLKNFSMINTGKEWSLAPAYDLLNVAIVIPKDKEEMALTLEGRKKKLKRPYFVRFGKGLGLNEKQIEAVFKRFIKNKPTAMQWIDNSFLSKENQKQYKALLNNRYSIID